MVPQPMPRWGLSPRRRGNQARRARVGGRGGPIPAQAGEPGVTWSMRRHTRAYPRAGGGTRHAPTSLSSMSGLSPRRRGNHAPERRCGDRMGPIPAQAGEPPASTRLSLFTRAYPRAGGGTTERYVRRLVREGLSPRRRGNRLSTASRISSIGPIPAQAGEPSPVSGTRSARRAYPRAGGGTKAVRQGAIAVSGLSPRRRGNQSGSAGCYRGFGPIPAQAGEPAPGPGTGTRIRAYPRAGGGTWSASGPSSCAAGLSPRRRGNPRISAPPE